MKALENRPFFAFPDPVGCDEQLFQPFRLQILNKINGFVHNSYGMALFPVFLGVGGFALRGPPVARDWH